MEKVRGNERHCYKVNRAKREKALPDVLSKEEVKNFLTIEEKRLEGVGCYDIHSLPDLPQKSSDLYSFYHIMMDYENPNIEDWKEYKPNGQPLLLSFDDIVITRKSR